MTTAEMVAGRELDAMVAEKVMGKCGHPYEHRKLCGRPWDTWWSCNKCGKEAIGPPAYSTDISAAWQVLDAMVWRVGTANIRLDMEDYGRGAMSEQGPERAVWVTIGEWTVCGPAPLAICRAALAALEVE